MPIVIRDASDAPFGSEIVQINSVNYYAEDISATKPVNVVDRTDEVGSVRDQVGVSGKITGTMTLQLETTTSAIPSPGDTLSGSYGTGSNTWFFVTEVGTPITMNDFRKVTIGFTQKLN